MKLQEIIFFFFIQTEVTFLLYNADYSTAVLFKRQQKLLKKVFD